MKQIVLFVRRQMIVDVPEYPEIFLDNFRAYDFVAEIAYLYLQDLDLILELASLLLQRTKLFYYVSCTLILASFLT
ncbi:MAG: hypothetical protein RRA15_02930 [bacterium]|nr:hypothetical protein [bacterium]